ncbi:uncharacterized protein LOC126621528 [Malus sylvestris]|uniref:uncharacterized protein LOC126621528 n=1 Tax=Malus sylvestris TaxID=3752 RepID=UPI0021AC07E6|nr:uncharacterized protein LOC126621528 [Malus sylvestris]
MTQLKNRDLLIMKDDNLIPEQRKETGQLRHHRSTSYTKGMQIHDRAHGKESGWTNISFNRQKRHKLPRAQIGESGRFPEFKDCRQVTCRGGTLYKVRSLRFLLKFCSSSGSNGINFCTVERVLTMHRFLKSVLLYCCNL